jgi:hypothetical protein
LREKINLLVSVTAKGRPGIVGRDGGVRGSGYWNVKNVVSGLDSAEKVLPSCRLKGYFWIVVASAFNVKGKDRGNHTIVIRGEDEPSRRVGFSQAMNAIGARRKCCAADDELKRYRYNQVVGSLCFGGHAKGGDTDKCDRDTQVQILHYFSFAR